MDQIVVSSGLPTFIDEIVESNAAAYVGKSVSVTAKFSQHWVETCRARLQDPQTRQTLLVDTTLIEPFEAKFGSLFQMIGELGLGPDAQEGLQLKARVVRCVDGMDLTRYRKAIECQRTYLAKRQG